MNTIITVTKHKNLTYYMSFVFLLASFFSFSQEKAKIDNIIILYGKPIGVCECLGKGKENCRGNGWIRDGAGYQKCPFFLYWDT